jgi:hypothetical protein
MWKQGNCPENSLRTARVANEQSPAKRRGVGSAGLQEFVDPFIHFWRVLVVVSGHIRADNFAKEL